MVLFNVLSASARYDGQTAKLHNAFTTIISFFSQVLAENAAPAIEPWGFVTTR
jgi:hypothetical protein